VGTDRGKKSKKAGWHLTLGLKEICFVGIGIMVLMMMSFALGALAGRGDIYRAAYSWGLMSPEELKVAQWPPATGAGGGPPATVAAPGAVTEPTNPAAVASAPATAVEPVPLDPATVPAPVAAKPERLAPVTGSIAPLSPPVATPTAKKKGKSGTIYRDPKAREEELRQVHQEMTKKLKFQNSFDTAPKARLPKPKGHEKTQAKTGGSKSQPTQVRVVQYRNSKEAQAKVAELQKQGVKATLKTSKDPKGTLYTVCKPMSAAQAGGETLAKKPEKSSGAAKKLKVE
jgi:hypothetical protein